MKTKRLLTLIPLVAGLAACEDFSHDLNSAPGELSWCWEEEALTKASAELPDTNDFILSVKGPDGKTVFEGKFGDSPASMEVSPGTYTVRAVSLEFTTPAFARPQYGDEQVVVVASGAKVNVKLECALLNAGFILKIDPSFLETYPNGVFYMKQASTRLMYAYAEKRAAYFLPGEVALTLYDSGQEETLLKRKLQARDMLSVKISAAGKSSSSINIAVDTTKNWMNEHYIIGGSNGGSQDSSSAINVPDVSLHVGEEGVWIYGYIVGGDLTSNGKTVKTSGITSRTHLALAARSSVTDKASCVAVELPSGSKVRDAVNLVDHPDLIGTRVYLKGNVVEKYYGTTGLKGTNDYAQK